MCCTCTFKSLAHNPSYARLRGLGDSSATGARTCAKTEEEK